MELLPESKELIDVIETNVETVIENMWKCVN